MRENLSKHPIFKRIATIAVVVGVINSALHAALKYLENEKNEQPKD
jgi:hypothetical protein